MRFAWWSVPPHSSRSMHVVSRENVAALEELGWARFEREEEADIVFSFFHQEYSRPDPSHRTRIFYLCTTSHNSIVARYVPAYREISASSGNLIFVLNRAMQRSFAEAGVRARVWNHGVNLEQFRPESPDSRRGGPLTFGYMGQSAPFKRVRFLYQAFCNAFDPGDRDVRLVLVTTPEMVRELRGGRGNVELRERIDHERTPEFYRSLDCFVTFSYSEGFNLTPLEALACGVPCIVPNSPEMHEPPYDRLCTHVPASRVVRPEVLLGQAFAPCDPGDYFAPPWVHEVAMEDAVAALRAFAQDPAPRRTTPLAPRFSWRGRIDSQLLPFLRS